MRNKELLVAILAVGVFSILNTEMGVIGILPMVSEHYGVDIVRAGLLMSLFAMGVAIAGPTMPLLFSRFNRKYVMLTVLGVFTVCNILSAVAPSFEILLAARVIPAFFHPVYCAMAFSVAAASVAPEAPPKAVARINMGVAAGMVLGVPVSNFLAAHVNLSASFAFFGAVTGALFLLTLFLVPSMPVKQAMSYGSQVRVLRRPSVWVSMLAVVLMNGSVFGVYNYLADYLARVTVDGPAWSAALLMLYGVMNLGGSWLGGQLLAKNPLRTVMMFPFAMIALYLLMAGGLGAALLSMVVLLTVWGILGGVNANINQFWLARAVPEAPDFGNGLFLTAANIGCVTGTAVSGLFIDSMGIGYAMLGGIVMAALALAVVALQCWQERAVISIEVE